MLKPLDRSTGQGSWSENLEQRTPLREDGQRKSALRQMPKLVPPPEPGPLVESGVAANPYAAASRVANPPLQAACWVKVPQAGVSVPVAEAKARGPAPSAPVVGSCQPAVDTKPFTGRGEPRAVRLALAAVDRLHDRMAELVAESNRSRLAQLYLALHVRSTGQYSLRWRGLTQTGRHAHLSWDEAEGLINRQPYAMRVQLLAWGVQAKALNADEIRARLELKRARAAAAKVAKEGQR